MSEANDAALDVVLQRLNDAEVRLHKGHRLLPMSRPGACAALRAALHDWTPPRPRAETLRRRQAYIDSWRGCGHRVEHPALDDDEMWVKLMGERFA